MTRGPVDSGVALGVDIGGTKVLGVAVDGADRVVAEARVATPHSAVERQDGQASARIGSEAADAVADVVDRLYRALSLPERRSGGHSPLGVGVPGMLNRSGVLVFAPNLPGASGADFRTLLSERVHGNLVIENDANCAVTAEHRLGAARGADDVLMATLGTGVGGGLLHEGRLGGGAYGFAGEIGHMVVDPSGPPCPCGRRGCWERYASGGGLGRLAREAAYAGRLGAVVALAGDDPELVRGEHVTRAALGGEPGAMAVMEDLGWWVALGLANLTALFDPSRIVLGGGLIEAGELLLAPTRRAFGELVEGGPRRPEIEIVAAQLGERAGAVGAALAARVGGLR